MCFRAFFAKFSATGYFFHEYGRRVGMVPRSSVKQLVQRLKFFKVFGSVRERFRTVPDERESLL